MECRLEKTLQGTFESIWMAVLIEDILRKIYSEKRVFRVFYTQKKRGKKFSVKLLCDRHVYLSHIEKIFFILRSFETAYWTETRRDIREHIQAYDVKGDIVREKLERRFLRNYIVVCAFH